MLSPTSAYTQVQTPFGYDDRRVLSPATTPHRSREEQIEADMPDFDSAAPGGTSLLYKRANQTPPSSAPPVSNLARQHTNPSVQSLPVQQQSFYNQQQDPTTMSLPEQRGPKHQQGGITSGVVFGVPSQLGQQQYYSEPQIQDLPPQNRGMPAQQYSRPQPPFAREQQPRRSMDDARQMPHRQGPPPQQRFQQDRQPSQGLYPPQQRPSTARHGTGQTIQSVRSDPGQQRYASAPPTRQHLHQPPSGPAPNGAALTQQLSVPNQQMPRSPSNEDSLPQHPVPVRSGLSQRSNAQPAKRAPVRNQDFPSTSQPQRQASVDSPAQPVTTVELDRLRASADAQPDNNKVALLLAKKLVEAADVLASEGGRADRNVTIKNRERYIMDAHKRVKKLVAAGFPDAQFYLADCYSQGSLGLETDAKEAFKLYQAAAKACHPEAAYRTAMCCELGPEEGGGTSKDYAKALQWYRRAAALGDPSAMYKLGIILLRGLLGQQRNVGEAVIWLKRAAEYGKKDNPHALHELATLYETANTNPEVRNKVVADDKYALDLFQKAAALGHKLSQFRLGQAYEYGNLGLPIDNRGSIAWYSKAAAQGEHQAELALSGWYLTGAEGILEHSDTEAYLWARKAASSEPPLAKAMFAMGYFTETGIGCPKSIDEAKRWYGRAACEYNVSCNEMNDTLTLLLSIQVPESTRAT